MSVSDLVFPVKLAGSNAVSQESVEQFLKHTEKEHKGGYFPLGANTVWHGGLHIHVPQRSDVFSIGDGEIVAARLAENTEKATGHFGSHNFILTRHEISGDVLNRQFSAGENEVQGSEEDEKAKDFGSHEKKYFYCLYMHLNNETLDSGANSKLKQIRWFLGQDGLLDDLRTGEIVKITGVTVKAGEQLWTSGTYGTEPVGMIHWEIFSEENLLPSFVEINDDNDDDYNMESEKVISVLRGSGQFEDVFNLTDKDVIKFYSSDRGSELSRYSCNFFSEWAMDIDKTIEKIKGRYSIQGMKEKLEPYIWWPKALEKGVVLPPKKRVWHYNPIVFVHEFATEYSICIELSDPIEEPYVNYRLKQGTEVEYHLDFAGMKQGDKDLVPVSGSFYFDKQTHRITVSKAQLESLKSIIIWSKEYGSAAFIDPGVNKKTRNIFENTAYEAERALGDDPDRDIAMGRLQILRERAQVIDRKANIAQCDLLFKGYAVISVVDFIVGEAEKNQRDPVMEKIKNLLSSGRAEKDEDRRDELLNDADNAWGQKVHKDEGVMGWAQDQWFHGGGEWDYKPDIRLVWGANQRLGNSRYVYFYDMWANFHYGFLGKLAGFEKAHLIYWANRLQEWDNGAYDPVDDVLTQIGFDLKVFTRKSLLAEINANREDFKQSVRDLYGKDQTAAKSYVDREFDRRGIPRPEEGYWD